MLTTWSTSLQIYETRFRRKNSITKIRAQSKGSTKNRFSVCNIVLGIVFFVLHLSLSSSKLVSQSRCPSQTWSCPMQCEKLSSLHAKVRPSFLLVQLPKRKKHKDRWRQKFNVKMTGFWSISFGSAKKAVKEIGIKKQVV